MGASEGGKWKDKSQKEPTLQEKLGKKYIKRLGVREDSNRDMK